MRMKKIGKVIVAGMFCVSVLGAGECADLMKKYNAPDPSTKTMKQLKRWVKRKIKDGNAKAVEECLVSKAADNPNKETVAGQ